MTAGLVIGGSVAAAALLSKAINTSERTATEGRTLQSQVAARPHERQTEYHTQARGL
jgi:hypothetical protein